MKILGFYIGGHDSNVTLVDDNGNTTYYKLERLVQIKHKKGSLNWVKEICNLNNFIPDIIVFSDGNRNNLGICEENELYCKQENLKELFNTQTYCIDHHYAHILSAWPLISKDLNIEYGVCIDGRGDHQIKCSVIYNPFEIKKSKYVYTNKESEFCLLFNKIGKLMNLKGGDLDFAGKIMGAHAYGEIR